MQVIKVATTTLVSQVTIWPRDKNNKDQLSVKGERHALKSGSNYKRSLTGHPFNQMF